MIDAKNVQTYLLAALWRIIASIMGIANAKVFPVPVLARPTISLPCIAGSRTALYTSQQKDGNFNIQNKASTNGVIM